MMLDLSTTQSTIAHPSLSCQASRCLVGDPSHRAGSHSEGSKYLLRALLVSPLYLQFRSVCDPAECVLTDAAGSGKSSLIRSIVQACEDIVHVDDFPPTDTSTPSRTSLTTIQLSQAHRLPLSTTSEIYASTKPYPSWWSDLEDSRVLRRRRSTGDVVLERNICFVDTPATSLSRTGQVDAIIHYIRQQLFRATTAIDSCNHDFQNLLAGQGGTQVDAVLYLVSAGMYSRLVRSR